MRAETFRHNVVRSDGHLRNGRRRVCRRHEPRCLKSASRLPRGRKPKVPDARGPSNVARRNRCHPKRCASRDLASPHKERSEADDARADSRRVDVSRTRNKPASRTRTTIHSERKGEAQSTRDSANRCIPMLNTSTASRYDVGIERDNRCHFHRDSPQSKLADRILPCFRSICDKVGRHTAE
jgi:hypothetical protein